MKKQSLEILHRYRKHLLEREQIALQDRMAEENMQKARLLQLQARVQETHDAKLKARTAEEMSSLDDAAAYLHGRMTMARRAITLATRAREEAMDQVLKIKQARDQVGLLIEKGRAEDVREQDASERTQLDDLATARHAMARGVV